MKVRSDLQLSLAMEAPPRPQYADAAGDETRWRALQVEWVASWDGRLLADAANTVKQKAWWKAAKKQHGELVEAGKQRLAAGSSGGPAPIDGLKKLTTEWVEQNAPELLDLSCQVKDTPGGGQLRQLRARVQGPGGIEEHAETIHFSPPAVLAANRYGRPCQSAYPVRLARSHGSRLMVHSSRPTAHGSRLKAHG